MPKSRCSAVILRVPLTLWICWWPHQRWHFERQCWIGCVFSRHTSSNDLRPNKKFQCLIKHKIPQILEVVTVLEKGLEDFVTKALKSYNKLIFYINSTLVKRYLNLQNLFQILQYSKQTFQVVSNNCSWHMWWDWPLEVVQQSVIRVFTDFMRTIGPKIIVHGCMHSLSMFIQTFKRWQLSFMTNSCPKN
jgi:hypothetical protein